VKSERDMSATCSAFDRRMHCIFLNLRFTLSRSSALPSHTGD
jgi:hypothetical protein